MYVYLQKNHPWIVSLLNAQFVAVEYNFLYNFVAIQLLTASHLPAFELMECMNKHLLSVII